MFSAFCSGISTTSIGTTGNSLDRARMQLRENQAFEHSSSTCNMMMSMKGVILHGGRGTRLRTLTACRQVVRPVVI